LVFGITGERIMALVKKFALAGLFAALGVVLYRFGRIVYRVLTEKPAPRKH
jgi:hypothetical protein